jgi:hypothetical protein
MLGSRSVAGELEALRELVATARVEQLQTWPRVKTASASGRDDDRLATDGHVEVGVEVLHW